MLLHHIMPLVLHIYLPLGLLVAEDILAPVEVGHGLLMLLEQLAVRLLLVPPTLLHALHALLEHLDAAVAALEVLALQPLVLLIVLVVVLIIGVICTSEQVKSYVRTMLASVNSNCSRDM